MTDLGKVGVMPKGEYVEGTEYEMLDLVYYDGSSYLALIDTAVRPIDDGINWMLIVQGTPVATTETLGKVKPDGTTITIAEDGTITGAKQVPDNVLVAVELGDDSDLPDLKAPQIDADRLGGELPEYFATAQSITDILDKISNAGLGSNNLDSTEWKNIVKNQELALTFYTNWDNKGEIPTRYGSGVIIPALDAAYKFIFHVGNDGGEDKNFYIGLLYIPYTDEPYRITWKKLISNEEFDTKTDKSDYKVYIPYDENSEENPCDLYQLDRGVALFPALVSVKNSPFLDNKVRDAAIFVPAKNFGWQLLGEFQGLFYQRFDWEGNPWGNWEQIVFASTISNPNLLINSDFKINQRGESSYRVTNRYSVDRWMGWNTIITPVEDGVLVEIAGTGYWEFKQFIEMDSKKVLGKKLTGSLCVDGTVYRAIFVVPETMSESWQNDAVLSGSLHLRLIVTEDTIVFFVYNNGVESYTFNWAKLEFGELATPFVPPNPATESLECQRYYKRIYLNPLSAYQYYTQKNRVYFSYHFGKMRTEAPTVSFVGTNAVDNVNTNNHFAVIKGGNAVSGWGISKDVQFEIALGNYENVSITATLPDSIPVTNKDFTLQFGKGTGIEVDAEIYG